MGGWKGGLRGGKVVLEGGMERWSQSGVRVRWKGGLGGWKGGLGVGGGGKVVSESGWPFCSSLSAYWAVDETTQEGEGQHGTDSRGLTFTT